MIAVWWQYNYSTWMFLKGRGGKFSAWFIKPLLWDEWCQLWCAVAILVCAVFSCGSVCRCCCSFVFHLLVETVVWLIVFHSKTHPTGSYVIMFSVWASSPQPAVVMWIMSGSWMLARNQTHTPVAGLHASIMTRVSGRSLGSPWEIAPHAQLSIDGKQRNFIFWIRDQTLVKSDSKSAGAGLDLFVRRASSGVDFKKEESNKRAPLHTCCILGSLWPLCQTMGVGFCFSMFRQTELSKDLTRLKIVHTYTRMDRRRAYRDVSNTW